MPFRQLKSFLKILIGVQYETRKGTAAKLTFCSGPFCYAFPEGQATSPSQRTQPPLC